MEKDIRDCAEAVRHRIEPHWDHELLYEKFEPKPNMPVSSGYCGPSSVYLWQELTEAFPDEEFSIAVGRVYHNSEEWVKGKHVWVVWHHGLKASTVIDITADQSARLEDKILFENIDELARRNINYVSYQFARSLDEVDPSPKRRSELLRERVENGAAA